MSNFFDKKFGQTIEATKHDFPLLYNIYTFTFTQIGDLLLDHRNLDLRREMPKDFSIQGCSIISSIDILFSGSSKIIRSQRSFAKKEALLFSGHEILG